MARCVPLAFLAILGAAPLSGGAALAATRACLDAAQSRAAVQEHKLANPAVAQRAAARHAGGGEFLRSRLCRWNDEYIYEITLLMRDGKIARVDIRASDGVVVGKPGE